MADHTKRFVAVLLVAGLVLALAAGGAIAQEDDGSDIHATQTMQVNEDGSVDVNEMRLEMDESTYEDLTWIAQMNGYETAAEYLAADFEENEPPFVSVSAEEYESDAGWVIDFDVHEYDVTANENMTVEVSSDTVEWETTDVGDDSDGSGSSTIVMPYEITDTNAPNVDGNEATWQTGDLADVDSAYAVAVEGGAQDGDSDDGSDGDDGSDTGDDSSDDPDGDEASDSDDGDGSEEEESDDADDDGAADGDSDGGDDGDDDGTPGFGVVVAIGGLLGAAAIVLRRGRASGR